MVPATAAVFWIGAALFLLVMVGFCWAWFHGQFVGLTAQSAVIFDADDWRYERPWETPSQREVRRATYGPELRPPPGEWGGAS